VGVIEEKGEGKESGKGLGLLLSPRCQLNTTRRKFSPRSYDSREGDSQQTLSLPLVGLRRRKRERREIFED
jgi:hypothetical protein